MQKEVKVQNVIFNSKHANKKIKKKNTNGTHTLRHVLVSKPGGRFPVRIGSICKNKNVKTLKERKEKYIDKKNVRRRSQMCATYRAQHTL